MWLNPTGFGIRSDDAGDGNFGSKRGDRTHLGLDFICTPGQGIAAPAKAQYRRLIRVYAGDPRWTGMEFDLTYFQIRFFYVSPSINIMEWVEPGDFVALAQDITEKYPNQGMTPHVHCEIRLKPFTALTSDGKAWNSKNIYISPKPFFFDTDPREHD